MKLHIVALCLLIPAALSADSIYRIDFTGTLNSGSATDYNLLSNTSQTVADLTGLFVSGNFLFDLTTAPAPTVTTDGVGNVSTTISTTGGPVYVSSTLQIFGLTTPAGFAPMPSIFNLPPFPALPGVTATQTTAAQQLIFSGHADGTAEAVIAGMILDYSWTAGTQSGSNHTGLNMLASQLAQFFPYSAAGGIPPSFGPETSGANGVFTVGSRAQDTNAVTAANTGGITTFYSVTGNFALTSASGFLVPEPASELLAAAGLIGLYALRVRRSS